MQHFKDYGLALPRRTFGLARAVERPSVRRLFLISLRLAAAIFFLCGVLEHSAAQTFSWPVDNAYVSQGYACLNCIGNGKYHTGLDIVSTIGSHVVRAAASGTVR